MKTSILLLKTLLLSTSGRNIFRYSKDKKKRRKIIGSTIGVICLYAMIVAYSIVICIGFGTFGIIGAAPKMCAVMISSLAFIFTLFKTNGYLFNFKEYDMLMSLPFEAKTVASCKFLYMYVKSLPWYLSISLPMLIGYAWFSHPSVMVYPIWILLTFFLPVIPMLAAAFVGFLIAKVIAGFRKTNIIQTILTMLFVLFCFSFRFIIEDLFRNDKVEAALEVVSTMTGKAAGVYLPASWFANAVANLGIGDLLLLTGVSIFLFGAVFYVVGRSYRNINSALKSHAASRNYRVSVQKQRSVAGAIAFKEFKRLTGSTVYMTNSAIGVVLAIVLSVITLIIGPDRIIAVVFQGAPLTPYMLQPAIPFIIYFFIGMLATTVCSPSLEGRNYWIIQSLPIEKKTVYQGKMLFNVMLTVPPMILSILFLCISAGTPVTDTILYLVLGIMLCAFSTAWGCVCGVRHMRLDWENEIEVIKQGAAVVIYMLPNMFVVLALTVLVVIVGMKMDHRLLTLFLILVVSVLAALSYWRVMRIARQQT